MSSFCTEAMGMYAGLMLFGKILQIKKIKVSVCTDNEALVRRIKKLIDFDPVSAYTKNYPNLYVGICEALNQLEIVEIGHVRSHQDQTR